MNMPTLAAAAPQVRQRMSIHLASGTGEGPTELAAFDAALMDAGVAIYNLLCPSSACALVVAVYACQPR